MTALVGLIMVAVWISALVDAILAPEDKVQRLPRVAWILLIVFLTVIGAILWFAFGRERGGGIRPVRQAAFALGQARPSATAMAARI